jgi:hypothetical protein
MRLRLLLFLALTLATPALATDGVLEINQTCAVETGCFAGDTAGFPVTIAATGSYLLTSDLDVTSESNPENVTAIDINTHGVHLDLNGFSIIGPGSTGTGFGVDAAFFNEVTVRNGTIRSMGDDGVRTDRRARIEELHVVENGGDGIFVDIYSIVNRNVAYMNGGVGISANESTVHGNSCHGNGGDGIDGNNGSSVWGNSSSSNGGDGIEVRFGSVVRGNGVRNNTGFGLNNSSGTSGYTENVFDGNNGANPEVSGGVQLGDNLCGSGLCP